MCTHSRVSVNSQIQPSPQQWLGLPWSIWSPDPPGVLSLSLETHTHGHPHLPGPFPLSSSMFTSSDTLSHTSNSHTRACSSCRTRTHTGSQTCPPPAAGPSYLIFSHHLPKSCNYDQKHSNCISVKTLPCPSAFYPTKPFLQEQEPFRSQRRILTPDPQGSSDSSSEGTHLGRKH